jgi:DNA mismatch repair protein MutL
MVSFVRDVSYTPPIAPRPISTQMPLVEFTKVPELKYKYLGQIFASFLVCEDSTGLLLVDQHALHEKQKFEELKKLYENKKSSQQLLISKILSLTNDKVTLILEHKSVFESLGFELEEYSGSLAIKTIPELLMDQNLEEMFLQFCLDLQTCESLDPKQVLRPLLATMACHSVVKANETLSIDKVRPLLNYLQTIEEGWTCPHGRPILFRMSLENIKKQFKRI